MPRGPTYLILLYVSVILCISVLVVDVGARPVQFKKCYLTHRGDKVLVRLSNQGKKDEHVSEEGAENVHGRGAHKEGGENGDVLDKTEDDGAEQGGGDHSDHEDGDVSPSDLYGSMTDYSAATPEPPTPSRYPDIKTTTTSSAIIYESVVREDPEYAYSAEVPEEPAPSDTTSESDELPNPGEPSNLYNSTRICDKYGAGVELKTGFEVSHVKDIYNRVFKLGRMLTPKVNEKQEIRFLVPPNDTPATKCTGGDCWACLTNDVDRNDPNNPYKYPTLETCHHGLEEIAEENKPGNDAYALALNRKYQLMGNWNTWKFIPSGNGPDDVPLYNVMGIPPGEPTWFDEYTDLFLANVVVYEIEIPEGTSDVFLQAYRELEPEIGKPVAFVNPCDGTILRDPFGHTALVPLSDLPGIYFLKDPTPDSLVTNPSTPINI